MGTRLTGSVTSFLEIRRLTVSKGGVVLQRDLSFELAKGGILAILGDAGAGRSTLLRAIVGLHPVESGEVVCRGRSVTSEADQQSLPATSTGILLSGGALLPTWTLLENVALPLRLHTQLNAADVSDLARLKMDLMGLCGLEERYPGEVDASRRLWAGLARATVLDPEFLLLEDPTAHLDPPGARKLARWIVRTRDDFGTTIVLASNDVPTVLAVADQAVFLDSERQTMTARGTPWSFRDHADPKVRAFLGARAE